MPYPAGGANRESGRTPDGVARRGVASASSYRCAEKRIPEDASTLHRLLGAQPGSQRLRHHAGNPLHLDVLVVDEASMIDLPMMSRLIDALPPHGRVIFLGDRDQLASVEAGAVLGDICAYVNAGFTAERARQLSRLTGSAIPAGAGTQAASLRDSLCLLQRATVSAAILASASWRRQLTVATGRQSVLFFSRGLAI